MPGWTAQVRNCLIELYEYWREIIILALGILFLTAGFLILYPIWWFVPPVLRPLLMVILPLSFVVLAAMTWSFLPYSFDWGTSYFDVSIQWVDFRIFYNKYRKYLFFAALVNVLYLTCLGMFLLILKARSIQALSSESLGILLLLIWILLNGALVIGSSLIIYFSEAPPKIVSILSEIWSGRWSWVSTWLLISIGIFTIWFYGLGLLFITIALVKVFFPREC
jgi:hypothetical protein